MNTMLGLALVGMMSTIHGHFFNEKAKGWHWYQQREADPKRQERKGDPNVPPSAATELATQRKALEEALAESLLRPTPRNVARYQRLQYQWLTQSHAFASVWQQNLLQHPELDATVKNPVTQYGIHIKKEEDQLTLEATIKALSQQYGLFFIYQGNCKWCQGMGHIVKQLSEKYGWKVLGISQDGVRLKEFPASKLDNGISQAWGLRGVPAVFVVNPETEQVIPIGHGLISLDQLERNLIRQVTGRS